MSTINDIAKELTLKAMEKGYIQYYANDTFDEIATQSAERITKFYQTIHKAVKEAHNNNYTKLTK